MARLGRKRPHNTLPDEEPPKKKAVSCYVIPLETIPFMLSAQICSKLDLKSQEALRWTGKLGNEVVVHCWEAKRHLAISYDGLKQYFPQLPETGIFESFLTIQQELVELFSWLRTGTIRELDLRGVKVVSWWLLQTIVDDYYEPGVVADVLKRVTKLHMGGCYCDDFYPAAEMMPNLETISLDHKNMHVYNPVEMQLPSSEVRGKMKDKRTATAQLLKHCFPRLQAINFY